MTGEPLLEDYDAYALGIGEGPELAQIRTHLVDRCAACALAARESVKFVVELSGAVNQLDPPARLRRRILAMVEDKPAGPYGSRASWLAASGMAITLLLAIFIVQERSSRSEERWKQATELLSAGDLQLLPVQHSEPSRTRVDVFASRSQGVLLVASEFRSAPRGKTYQMWTIGKNAAPVPGGIFTPRRDGTVLHVTSRAGESLTAVAITVEPKGGSDHPTAKPFLVASVP